MEFHIYPSPNANHRVFSHVTLKCIKVSIISQLNWYPCAKITVWDLDSSDSVSNSVLGDSYLVTIKGLLGNF
jgi:hypothetical protein